MNRNKKFIMRKLSDKFVLVPIGTEALDFNGVITLNETAAFLWEQTEDEFSLESLIEKVRKKYDVDEATAKQAVDIFIKQLAEVGCLE